MSDPVGTDTPGAAEIGFSVPERYNASAVLFDNLDAGRGARTAVLSGDLRLTYAGLCVLASQAGHAFAAAGLERSERVVMLLDDTAVYPAAFFGAVRAGYVPVLVNILSPAELVRYYIEDSGARVIVAEANMLAVLAEALDEGPNVDLVVVANGDVPSEFPAQVRSWEDFIGSQETELAPADTHRDDMAFWMYSSGSTGRPKGIVHLQHDMIYTHLSYGESVLALTEDDIVYSVPKIFFAYGFGNSITFPFAVGAAVVLNPGRPEPAPIYDAIEAHRPTVFFGLPTLYNAMVAHEDSERRDLSSVRMCISAAEPLPAETFREWKRRYNGLEILEGLGSTEVL
ncbi:MAG: AMP-binding protein, partial [Alphaproteobacteria bacterium]|nr:AMP-binding protein [Alphaproteobacteria bacterium]